jgi:hypothetical protein
LSSAEIVFLGLVDRFSILPFHDLYTVFAGYPAMTVG